MKNAVEKRENF